jgi:GLPGLI family protein
MKTLIKFFLIILCSNNIYAQFIVKPLPINISQVETVDSGNIKILYALNATNIKDTETYDDLQRLEIGENVSKYYSVFLYVSDSLSTDWGNKNKGSRVGTYSDIQGKKTEENWREYQFLEYFKNFKTNVLTVYARMPKGIGNCKVSENIPFQNWELREDTLTITGYSCQKAECIFRGRNYTAWFASDIPINNGPWKFGGLPGLILKVYDNDKYYVFECISIENYKKKYPINEHNSHKNYSGTERKKLSKLLKNIHEDYITTAGVKVLSNNIDNIRKKTSPYNPLELE